MVLRVILFPFPLKPLFFFTHKLYNIVIYVFVEVTVGPEKQRPKHLYISVDIYIIRQIRSVKKNDKTF